MLGEVVVQALHNKALWAARRLSAMSGGEILHRIKERARRSVDRRRAYDWSQFDEPGPIPVFPGLREAVLARGGERLVAAVLKSAREIADGRFEALGVAWPERPANDLFPEELWRLDPVTGELWPGETAFSADIDYRHQRRLGSIKYVWELNRLQFLQPLAAAQLLQPDPRFLEVIEAAIASWWRANPPYRGIGWNSGIEISARALSLVAVTSFCGEALSADTCRRIRSILSASLYWLDRYPSRFSSANNHLMMEALGVFVIGELLPDLPNAVAAGEARRILVDEAQRQILPDGVGAEQSPTYAAITAEALLTAALLARGFGRPLEPVVDERLAAFAEWIGWFSTPRGATPGIGDDDEGSVWLSLSPRMGDYPASVAAAVAGFLGRPASGPAPSAPELRAAIFGSPQGAAPAPVGVRSFDAGGYTVVRERRSGRDLKLILDHGPLGYLSIAAHGHADANSILLALDGEEVLVDPGTYIYHAEDAWRDWFRGTRAHNTLVVEGANQSLIAGPFMWSHKARARLVRVDAGADWRLAAVHDGYRSRFGVDHRRVVQARGDDLVIIDTLEPARSRKIEATFQFASGIEVRREAEAIVALKGAAPILRLRFEASGEVAVGRGGASPDGGWVSPAFGSRAPACRLSWLGVAPAEGLKTVLTLM